MHVTRFDTNPIIRPHLDARLGDNINGPSLIKVPSWVDQPLGRYYLYFGHHDGRYIRLAYSNELRGSWRIWRDGVLPLEASHFRGHVASPDVHVDHEAQQFRLYYHGSDTPTHLGGEQSTRVALSGDGLRFQAQETQLGPEYFRVFRWADHYYALVMPGVMYRSTSGLTPFECGPSLFSSSMWHSAVHISGSTLSVFYSNAGDCPERILRSTIELDSDWARWQASAPVEVLKPERDYEGGELPLLASKRGMVVEPVRQLRDPALYVEGGRCYLLYTVAGEQGIAIAELDWGD